MASERDMGLSWDKTELLLDLLEGLEENGAERPGARPLRGVDGTAASLLRWREPNDRRAEHSRRGTVPEEQRGGWRRLEAEQHGGVED